MKLLGAHGLSEPEAAILREFGADLPSEGMRDRFRRAQVQI